MFGRFISPHVWGHSWQNPLRNPFYKAGLSFDGPFFSNCFHKSGKGWVWDQLTNNYLPFMTFKTVQNHSKAAYITAM